MVNYQELSNGFMFSFAVYGLILFIDDVRIVIKEKFFKNKSNEIKQTNVNETDSDTSDDVVVIPYTDILEKNEDGYNTQPSDNEENNELLHKRRRTE
jgi:hypothetical protein